MREVRPKLLIIDDNQDVLAALRVFFTKANCQVFIALSGENGLALAKQHIFDTILIDLIIPGIGGGRNLEKNETYPSSYSAYYDDRSQT